MKKIWLTISALLLTACIPGLKQELPPELRQVPPAQTPAVKPTPKPPAVTEPVTPPTGEVVPTAQCETLSNNLVEAFVDVNYCETDSDCQVAPSVCPFGCYFLYHKNLNFDSYAQDLSQYDQNCEACDQTCDDIVDLPAPRCAAGKCVLPVM